MRESDDGKIRRWLRDVDRVRFLVDGSVVFSDIYCFDVILFLCSTIPVPLRRSTIAERRVCRTMSCSIDVFLSQSPCFVHR